MSLIVFPIDYGVIATKYAFESQVIAMNEEQYIVDTLEIKIVKILELNIYEDKL